MNEDHCLIVIKNVSLPPFFPVLLKLLGFWSDPKEVPGNNNCETKFPAVLVVQGTKTDMNIFEISELVI
jgi:hypothetical protein